MVSSPSSGTSPSAGLQSKLALLPPPVPPVEEPPPVPVVRPLPLFALRAGPPALSVPPIVDAAPPALVACAELVVSAVPVEAEEVVDDPPPDPLPVVGLPLPLAVDS